MTIKDWENKKFKGSNFKDWTYDYSMPIGELEKTGYPFAMACFAVNDKEFIAVGVERSDQSPRDFINANQNKDFILDLNKKPKQMQTMIGTGTVYYAKKV